MTKACLNAFDSYRYCEDDVATTLKMNREKW